MRRQPSAPGRRRRRLRRPRGGSIVVMLLLSFVLVLVPLLVAIGLGAVSVSRLSAQAATALDHSTALAKNAKEVLRDVREMERNTLQAAQLAAGSEELATLASAYRLRQERFDRRLAALMDAVDDAVDRNLLRGLRLRSQALADAFTLNHRLPAKVAAVRQLGDLAEAWNERVEYLVELEPQRVQQAAERTRERLTQLMIAAVAAALCLIVLFTVLITRSLHQISRAINQLGASRFDETIAVRGPADLRQLGDELDTLRQRLKRAERQKQRFLRHMSHELKTPLASLLEGTELFVDGSLGDLPSAQSEVAGILRSNAQELRHLIENLLDYSAWQSHGGLLRCTEFEFEVLFEQVLDQYRLAMRTRRLNVDRRIVPVRMLADRDKLRTVLSNLVSNAVKYTPPEGTLYVRAYAAREHLRLDFADSGPNIPREERRHVFEPFFTGRPPEQAHLKGSGIGLSLVSEYVRAHGGTVELVDGVYTGAHFRIAMPVQAQSGPVRMSA